MFPFLGALLSPARRESGTCRSTGPTEVGSFSVGGRGPTCDSVFTLEILEFFAFVFLFLLVPLDDGSVLPLHFLMLSYFDTFFWSLCTWFIFIPQLFAFGMCWGQDFIMFLSSGTENTLYTTTFLFTSLREIEWFLFFKTPEFTFTIHFVTMHFHWHHLYSFRTRLRMVAWEPFSLFVQ